MDMVDTMPQRAALVVNPLRGPAARRTLIPAFPSALLGVMLVLSGLTMMSSLLVPGIVLAMVGLLGFAIAALGVLAWRGEVLLGPILAADSEAVWVRLGGMLRPRIAHLPWSEISGVRCDTWAAPTGRTIPFVCFDASDAAERVSQDPRLAKSTKRALDLFGTPFVLNDRQKDLPIAEIVERIKPLAEQAGVETEDLYLR